MQYLFLILASLITLTGCTSRNNEPVMTQLQVREIQTRIFEVNDAKLVMKAMINVLQDDGFIVKNAVLDLGLLNAQKEVDVEESSEKFLNTLLCGANARWSKHSILEASANVSEYGNQIKVRMNFQAKTLDNLGVPKDVEQITQDEYYQEFFAKVSKSIFLQTQQL